MKQQGFNIKGISSDTYQSAQIQQDLQKDGFNTKIISVDRVDNQSKICLPYQYLKSAIYERRVEIYKICDQLTDELIGLERMSNGKIDHTERGINSKDQADAFCGSLYLASQFADQYSFDYGETLNDIVNVSSSNNLDDRKQVTIAFEEELKNKLDPLKNKIEESAKINKEEPKKEKPVFKDFGLGAAKPVNPMYLNDGILFW